MDQLERAATRPAPLGSHQASRRRSKPLTLRERFRQRAQAARLRRLLREWERENGHPIPEDPKRQVEREWPRG